MVNSRALALQIIKKESAVTKHRHPLSRPSVTGETEPVAAAAVVAAEPVVVVVVVVVDEAAAAAAAAAAVIE